MARLAPFALILALEFPIAFSQTGNTLFGDFEVADVPDGTEAPAAFQILLLNRGLQVVGRETVGRKGRYRFLDVANGEYYLVVQVEGVEVVRLYYRMEEIRPTDVRKDIQLQWTERQASPSSSGERLQYARSQSSQSSLDKARRLLAQGKVKDAAGRLRRLLQEDPKDFEIWTELGTARFREEDLTEAQSCYEKAVQLRSDFTPALVNLAKVHFARKAFGPAAEFFRQALATRADLAEVHFLLAESYLQLKKGTLAVEHFEKALELEPDDMSDAHLRMATLYRAAGWTREAVLQYQEFLEKKPDHPGRAELERYIEEHLEKSP